MIIGNSKSLPGLQKRTVIQASNLSDGRVRLLIAPLERGMAMTLGATLHKTLMRPVQGGRPARGDSAEHPLARAHTPARQASYRVEDAGVTQGRELECLILEVQTDESISPCGAVQLGAALLTESCLGMEPPEVTCPSGLHTGQQAAYLLDHERAGLTRTVEELELGVRACNCLRAVKIHFVGDLIQRTEAELLRIPHLGRRGCQEIRHALASRGLMLGTRLHGWPCTSRSSAQGPETDPMA